MRPHNLEQEVGGDLVVIDLASSSRKDKDCMCAFIDNKDFDVYISYARNSEDEYFVLTTLRCVLENHFGYSVCIFDRDSLPGGSEYKHTHTHTPLDYCTYSVHPNFMLKTTCQCCNMTPEGRRDQLKPQLSSFHRPSSASSSVLLQLSTMTL